MVEHLDDFEVLAVGQRQDPVAGAEPRMDAPVNELFAQQPGQPLGGADQAVRPSSEREMVEVHARSLWPRASASASGVGTVEPRPSGGRGGRPGASGGRPGAGSAESAAARTRSQCSTRTSYAGWPISSTSSRRVGDVDGVGADVGLGVAGAVPVEVVAALAPAPAVVLRDRHLGVRRVVARSTSRKSRRIGSCQHTLGFVSTGWWPLRSAQPCSAQPCRPGSRAG